MGYIVIGILLADFASYSIWFIPRYGQTPLDIKSFDGYNQPFHPSVIFLPNAWHGYNYWLVQSPYPMGGLPYRDRWECPCIYASADGIVWDEPGSITNPIDDLTIDEIYNKDFFSDPHLVFKGDSLECWYRISNHIADGHVDTYLLRKKSADGIVWTDREILADPNDICTSFSLGKMIRSQAVIYDEGFYKMWYVDNLSGEGTRKVKYATSYDGYVWNRGGQSICIEMNTNINPWHIDVMKDDTVYYMVVYDFSDLFLLQSNDGIHFSIIKKKNASTITRVWLFLSRRIIQKLFSKRRIRV